MAQLLYSFANVDAMWQLPLLEFSHDKSFVENFGFAYTVAKINFFFFDSSPTESNLFQSAAKIKQNITARELSKLQRCCLLTSHLVDALFVLSHGLQLNIRN